MVLTPSAVQKPRRLRPGLQTACVKELENQSLKHPPSRNQGSAREALAVAVSPGEPRRAGRRAQGAAPLRRRRRQPRHRRGLPHRCDRYRCRGSAAQGAEAPEPLANFTSLPKEPEQGES